jgi:hypothetical protein
MMERRGIIDFACGFVLQQSRITCYVNCSDHSQREIKVTVEFVRAAPIYVDSKCVVVDVIVIITITTTTTATTTTTTTIQWSR